MSKSLPHKCGTVNDGEEHKWNPHEFSSQMALDTDEKLQLCRNSPASFIVTKSYSKNRGCLTAEYNTGPNKLLGGFLAKSLTTIFLNYSGEQVQHDLKIWGWVFDTIKHGLDFVNTSDSMFNLDDLREHSE